MFAILHFTAVKKSRHGNMFALSETVRSEVCVAPASVGPTAQRVGGTYGDEGKAVGSVLPTALLSEFRRHENAA